jgi:hypothetical protein
VIGLAETETALTILAEIREYYVAVLDLRLGISFITQHLIDKRNKRIL